MKILHVTKKYPNALGGDAIVVSNLEKQQKKAGNKVIILTSNCTEIKKGKNVYSFGIKDTSARLDRITAKRLISLLILYFKAYKVFKSERPDIVHTHSVDMAFFISFAARRYKIPIVHTFHIMTFNDTHQTALRRKTELFLLRKTKPRKIFVLNSSYVKDLDRVGFQNSIFVPNGVNIEEWHIRAKKNKKFTFIAVGRLEEQKGFTYLIEAAAKLYKHTKDFEVQIVGEGTQRTMLNALIQRYSLQDHVYLFGRRPPAELKKLYASAHVFVLSSLWEGMPLTLLEAWAMHLPVIATEVGEFKDIVGKSLVSIKPGEPGELFIAMKGMMTEKHAVLTQQTDLIIKKYSWKHIAKTINCLYEGEVA